MSFSSELKQELLSVSELSKLSDSEASAMLYGMFYAGRISEKKPVIRTESEILVTAAKTLLERVFPNERIFIKKLVGNNDSVYTLGVHSRGVYEKFGDFTSVSVVAVPGSDEVSSAFLRGIFTSCGSVTEPVKEYHLEFTVPETSRVRPLFEFIEEHGFPIKETRRGRQTALYFKDSEVIEDFLTYIGAGHRALEIMQIKIEKDLRNRANRVVNCDSANLDRTVAASERTRREIEFLLEKTGFEGLSDELRETARLRLDNPESSLSELASMHVPPISRSGLNHRLKKLEVLAEKARASEQ